MKRTWLGLLALTISACAPIQDNDQQVGSYVSCPAEGDETGSNTVASAMSRAGSARDVFDPFEMYGKVLLDSKSKKSLTSQAQSQARERRVPAGESLSVTLREGCGGKTALTQSLAFRRAQDKNAHSTRAGVRSYTLRLKQDLSISELQQLANADSCVVGVSSSMKSYVTSISSASDPLSLDQHHLKQLETDSALAALTTVGGAPATIAIVDTGIDLEHEDLKDVIWVNSDEIPNNGADDDRNGYVDDYHGYNFANEVSSPEYVGTWFGNQHGTHVAGLAAAKGGNARGGRGVLPSQARVMALNVFGDEPGALSSNVANAVRYATDNGADVINLSVGGVGESAVYESAIVYALKKGVVVVAAAGNEAHELSDSYFLAPAAYAPAYRGMISVGSIDTTDESYSYFSNFGPDFVEIAAPGSERSQEESGLLSTWPGNKYERLQGTSMSAPVVSAGAAAAIKMLRGRGYAPSAATVEGVLSASAKRIKKLQEKVREGRSLNLRYLSEYINKNYPAGGHGDPGVRGVNDCDPGRNL